MRADGSPITPTSFKQVIGGKCNELYPNPTPIPEENHRCLRGRLLENESGHRDRSPDAQRAANVPVEVAADAAARKLLGELARSAGRTVERASAGIFLTPPVVQPSVEQRAVPAAPGVSAGPKPRRTRGNGVKRAPKTVRQYATLSTTFFKGSSAGQINSVFKTREYNYQKVSDYKQALADGACTLGNVPLSKSLIAKLQTLGIEVPATAD